MSFFQSVYAQNFSAGEKEALLNALNIIQTDEQTQKEKTITRAEFCYYVVCLFDMEQYAETFSGETVFSDVSEKTAYYPYIGYAKQQGIISGEADGKFNPNTPITIGQSYTMLLNGAGYRFFTMAGGGYLDGYSQLATQLGLNENIKKGVEDTLTYEDCIQILYNSLFINPVSAMQIGEKIHFESDSENILNGIYGIYRGTGVISAANGVSSTDSAYKAENEIKIGTQTFTTSLQDANLYVGYNVIYYYYLEKNEICLVIPYKNDELVLDASQLLKEDEGFSAEKLVYENENGRVQTARFSSKGNVIYNEEAYPDYNADTFKIQNGKIRLIDSDKNGTYETAVIQEYENIIVKYLSKLTYTIQGEYGEELQLADSEFLIYGADGAWYEFLDISVGDVLSIYQSKSGAKITIYASNAKLYGQIQQLNLGQDDPYIIVDDKQYIFDEKFKKQDEFKSITMDHTAGFYLDQNGKIAGIIDDGYREYYYGYVVGAYFMDDDENGGQIKVFNHEGEFERLNFNKKVKIELDGMFRNRTPAEVVQMILDNGKYMLIRYKKNEQGAVSQVELAKNNLGTNKNKDEFSFDAKLENAEYRENILGSQYLISDAETIIFGIPDLTNGINEKQFTVGNNFEVNNRYDVEIYDANETMTAAVIITRPMEGNINYDINMTVVDRVEVALNEEEEIVNVLYGYREGLYVSYEIDPNFMNETVESLQTGDAVQLNFNASGQISNIRVLLKTQQQKTLFEKPMDGDYTGAKLYVQYGIADVVKSQSGENRIVVSSDGGKTLRPNYANTAFVYLYDTLRGRVFVVTFNDIKSSTSPGKFNGDKVFVNKRWDSVKDILIVR